VKNLGGFMKKFLFGILSLTVMLNVANARHQLDPADEKQLNNLKCQKNVEGWINDNMSPTEKIEYARKVCLEDTNSDIVFRCLQDTWTWQPEDAEKRYEVALLSCKGLKYKPLNYTSCLNFGFHHVVKSAQSAIEKRLLAATYCNKLNFPPIAIVGSSLDVEIVTRAELKKLNESIKNLEASLNKLSDAVDGKVKSSQALHSEVDKAISIIRARSSSSSAAEPNVYDFLRRSSMKPSERVIDDFLRNLGASELSRDLYRSFR
jgi:hypothetical protein